MLTILLGIFLILHALVHLLYAGQAGRFFELRAGMVWPDDSWLFSKRMSDGVSRRLAAGSLALAALGFLASGIGLFFRLSGWQPAAVGAAIFSAAIFFLFWNGKLQGLDEQGGVGLLINLAILGSVLLLEWPL